MPLSTTLEVLRRSLSHQQVRGWSAFLFDHGHRVLLLDLQVQKCCQTKKILTKCRKSSSRPDELSDSHLLHGGVLDLLCFSFGFLDGFRTDLACHAFAGTSRQHAHQQWKVQEGQFEAHPIAKEDSFSPVLHGEAANLLGADPMTASGCPPCFRLVASTAPLCWWPDMELAPIARTAAATAKAASPGCAIHFERTAFAPFWTIFPRPLAGLRSPLPGDREVTGGVAEDEVVVITSSQRRQIQTCSCWQHPRMRTVCC